MYEFDAAAASIAHACTTPIVRPTEIDSSTRSTVENLRLRIERQSLLIQTLLMILLEKKVIHEDEFKEWVKYVDQLDGRKDGRLRDVNAPLHCPECQRMSPKGSPKCIYCGHELEEGFLYERKKTE